MRGFGVVAMFCSLVLSFALSLSDDGLRPSKALFKSTQSDLRWLKGILNGSGLPFRTLGEGRG